MQVNQTPWNFLGILCDSSNTHSRKICIYLVKADHISLTYAVSATVGTILFSIIIFAICMHVGRFEKIAQHFKLEEKTNYNPR